MFHLIILPVLPDRQPSAQRRPAGCVPVLPALLPAAAGVRAAGGSAGHLEGGVSPAESQRRRQHSTRLQPASRKTLSPHSGAGKAIGPFLEVC